MSLSEFHRMVNYIHEHKSDVPEELRSKCKTDENGFTIAMHWLRIMKNEINELIDDDDVENTIPKWMWHDSEIVDKQKWSIAMHWVSIFHCDVPKWMRHNPNLQNAKGKTIGMLYLMSLMEGKNKKDVKDIYFPECRVFQRH